MKRKDTKFKWLRLGLSLSLALLLAWALHQAPSQQASQTQAKELRGVWLTNIGAAYLYQTTRVDEVLHQLATLHLTTVYPAVWNRGYTLYPSAVAHQQTGYKSDPLLTLPFQNVFSSLTKQAHRQGLSIVPWFEYGFMSPATSSLVQRHPDWVTQTSQGQSVLQPHSQNSTASRLPTPLKNLLFEITGANLVWLNPFHPEVQQFFTDLILEVVNQYDVDGIQLDDHFGLPAALGYDPYTVVLYQQEHWGASPPQDPYNWEWTRWRSQKLTQFMTSLSAAIKNANPDCIISLSPNLAPFALREYLQNWMTWARSGLVDEVVVQVYRSDVASLEAELGQASLQQAQAALPVSIGLYTGPVTSAQPLKKIAEQVKTVRQWGYNGVSFFCWETTFGFFKKDSNGFETTWRELFPAPTVPSG